uniref:Putative secreted protein n=1 Tax=Anopheles darlingi TaxID=43151 RepID=A0A2M4DEZ8_ANODA
MVMLLVLCGTVLLLCSCVFKLQGQAVVNAPARLILRYSFPFFPLRYALQLCFLVQAFYKRIRSVYFFVLS